MRWTDSLPTDWQDIPRCPPVTRRVREVTLDRLDAGVVVRSEENPDAYVYSDGAVPLDAAR